MANFTKYKARNENKNFAKTAPSVLMDSIDTLLTL